MRGSNKEKTMLSRQIEATDGAIDIEIASVYHLQ